MANENDIVRFLSAGIVPRLAAILVAVPCLYVITLRGGHEVELEDSQDVSDSHDGVLILEEDGEIHEWIAWDDIEIVRFE